MKGLDRDDGFGKERRAVQVAMVEHHLLGVGLRPLGVGHCKVVEKVVENRATLGSVF